MTFYSSTLSYCLLSAEHPIICNSKSNDMTCMTFQTRKIKYVFSSGCARLDFLSSSSCHEHLFVPSTGHHAVAAAF
jgi:hypothetical protein